MDFDGKDDYIGIPDDISLKPIDVTLSAWIKFFNDDDSVVNSLNKCLSQEGYEVFTFSNPIVCPIYEKRRDYCLIEDPCADIVITDFNMPDMNGIERLQYQSQMVCKIDKRNKAIVSGDMNDEIKKVIDESGYPHFKKPLDTLLISDWLNKCGDRIDLSLPLSSF